MKRLSYLGSAFLVGSAAFLTCCATTTENKPASSAESLQKERDKGKKDESEKSDQKPRPVGEGSKTEGGDSKMKKKFDFNKELEKERDRNHRE